MARARRPIAGQVGPSAGPSEQRHPLRVVGLPVDRTAADAARPGFADSVRRLPAQASKQASKGVLNGGGEHCKNTTCLPRISHHIHAERARAGELIRDPRPNEFSPRNNRYDADFGWDPTTARVVILRMGQLYDYNEGTTLEWRLEDTGDPIIRSSAGTAAAPMVAGGGADLAADASPPSPPLQEPGEQARARVDGDAGGALAPPSHTGRARGAGADAVPENGTESGDGAAAVAGDGDVSAPNFAAFFNERLAALMQSGGPDYLVTVDDVNNITREFQQLHEPSRRPGDGGSSDGGGDDSSCKSRSSSSTSSTSSTSSNGSC
jgi:hypothetical protein